MLFIYQYNGTVPVMNVLCLQNCVCRKLVIDHEKIKRCSLRFSSLNKNGFDAFLM